MDQLVSYLKELFPAWEQQLCDPEANAMLPHVLDVGIGVEVAIKRPDVLHHDKVVE